jgi:hypothetical protein
MLKMFEEILYFTMIGLRPYYKFNYHIYNDIKYIKIVHNFFPKIL